MFLTNASTLAIYASEPVFSRSSQTLTPVNVTLPSSFFAISVRWGIETLHGPHQVAQNSTTYTLPGSNLATGVPFTHLATLSGGGAMPTSSLAAPAGAWAAAAAIRDVSAAILTGFLIGLLSA